MGREVFTLLSVFIMLDVLGNVHCFQERCPNGGILLAGSTVNIAWEVMSPVKRVDVVLAQSGEDRRHLLLGYYNTEFFS